jgi:glycosyltransferase involved in cell wall biosynthesis
VLLVSQRFPPHHLSGAPLQALGLARELRRRGPAVDVLSTRFQAVIPPRETVEGVPVKSLPVLRGKLQRASQFAAAARFVAARGRRYDVIHAYALSASAMGAVVGARWARRPAVIEPSTFGPKGEIQAVVASRLSPILLNLVRRTDAFAALSDELADELRRIGVREHQIRRVDNGVDLTRFSPAGPDGRAALREQLSLPDGPTALFAGRLIRAKGIGELLAGWRQVRAGRPNTTLLIAGEGPEAAAVIQRTRETDSGVRYLGLRRDVPDLMRASDVFVSPSHSDLFACAVIEAMASGLPIVVSPTGRVANLPVDGEAGRFVDPAKPGKIAKALSEILDDPERGRAWGARGRALAAQFDFRAVTDSYLALYEELTSGSGVPDAREPEKTNS